MTKCIEIFKNNKSSYLFLFVWSIIGYLYLQSFMINFVFLMPIYLKILVILFIILMVLNLSFLSCYIVYIKKQLKRSIMTITGSLFGIIGLSGCLAGCGISFLSPLLVLLSSFFAISIEQLGLVFLILSIIILSYSLYNVSLKEVTTIKDMKNFKVECCKKFNQYG